MVHPVSIRAMGNNLIEYYSDGSTRLFAASAGGFYLPRGHQNATTVPTGAGETSVDNSDGGGSTPGTVTAATDDYPWPRAPEDALSPLRYSYRDCTDFVAWRINRDNGITHSPWKYTWGNLRWQGPGGNGDAIGWKADWVRYGRAVDLPAAAGLIGWYGSKAGAYGHVNYVQAVAADGTVHLEEYNWSPNHQAYNQRDAAPGSAYYPDSFLAIPH